MYSQHSGMMMGAVSCANRAITDKVRNDTPGIR